MIHLPIPLETVFFRVIQFVNSNHFETSLDSCPIAGVKQLSELCERFVRAGAENIALMFAAR